ncbi:hypothetical protein BDQ17DRAFT_1352619 [Cyathus striatus]|nr:hypothetical protein BDQ17DRAFT_1352619 [Cyathus striatus]
MSSEKEPQNTLTRRFTDAEWRVLKELRVSLPNIFAEAFPLKEDATKTPVTIWGVEIDPLNPFDARVSVILMQFLRDENLSVPSAWDRLRDMLRWRDRVNIEKAMIEFPPDNPLPDLLGFDKEKRPIISIPDKRWPERTLAAAGVNDIDEYRRKRISKEERIKLLFDYENNDQCIQIIDLKTLPGGIFGHMKLPKYQTDSTMKEIDNEIQRHYPKSRHTIWFINAPGWFTIEALKNVQFKTVVNRPMRVGRNSRDVQMALKSIIEDPEPDMASKIEKLIIREKSILKKIYRWLLD